MKIHNDCAIYYPWHSAAKWLIAHAGDEVEVLSVEEGAFPAYTVKSLVDGTIGRAWAREIVGL